MNTLRGLRAGLILALAGALDAGASWPVSGADFAIPNGDVAALRRALKIAGSNAQADTISLAAGGAYTLAQAGNAGASSGSNGLPVIQPDGGQALSLLGNGATIARSVAPGTPAFRLLMVNYSATLNVSRLALRNGSTSNTGGAINNAGFLTLDGCVLSGNASAQGGALVSYGGLLLLRSCVLSGSQ